MWTRFAALCAVSSLVSQTAAQQSPPPEQPTFRAEVSVVEVVAVVTGEDDRSLKDLTASDFEVIEDGEPRTLLSVRRLTTSTTAATRRTPVNVEDAYVEQLATNADVADAPAFVLLLATVDDEGRMANQRQLRMAPPPPGAPWEVTTDLALPRGHHQLRVAAVTADAARTGLVLTPIEIIEPGRDLVMTPPVLLDTTEGQVHPTAVRAFVTGDPLGVQVEVGGRAVQQRAVTVQLSLLDAAGRSVRRADAILDPGARPDHQRATAVMPTDGVDAGAYALLVEATDGTGKRSVRHVVPIEIAAHNPALTTAGLVVVPHSVVARGLLSKLEAPGTFVIRTEQEWRAFWGRLPTRQEPPDIDFARVVLLAVIGDPGTVDPTVDAVTQSDGTTVVRWSAANAAEAPHAPGAGRHPFVVVGLVEHQSDEVRFERIW